MSRLRLETLQIQEKSSVYAMCLNSPEDTSLLILRHIEEPVFVIREKKIKTYQIEGFVISVSEKTG